MQAYIIKKPVVTEKSLALASQQNTYVFRVARTARKNQIKAVVEQLFKVDVISVNTVMDQRQSVRTGKKRLKQTLPKTKKALVKLKSGDSIALFDTTQS